MLVNDFNIKIVLFGGINSNQYYKLVFPCESEAELPFK